VLPALSAATHLPGNESMSESVSLRFVIAFCIATLGLFVAWLADGDLALFSNENTTPNDRVRSSHAAFAPLRAAEPFGLEAEPAPDGELWAKWRRVEVALRDEMKIVARCRAAPDACNSAAALQFIAIVEDARLATGLAQLGSVNRAVNLAVRYASDYDQHGIDDHWNSPLATLSSGRGDCEDYAIAKLAVLREAGVAAEDLRIVVVRDLKQNEYHATLAARAGGGGVVLDNRRNTLLEDRAFSHVVPLFAVRHDIGLMQYAKTATSRRVGAAAGERAYFVSNVNTPSQSGTGGLRRNSSMRSM
jgi:predicted transglutaminase-like cysteine proteinase